jgi:predicted RNase H-like HicB family nuclease
MREAIELHLEDMREDGEAIPEPNSDPASVDVDVPAQAANAS